MLLKDNGIDAQVSEVGLQLSSSFLYLHLKMKHGNWKLIVQVQHVSRRSSAGYEVLSC